jgi:hypothetical protein
MVIAFIPFDLLVIDYDSVILVPYGSAPLVLSYSVRVILVEPQFEYRVAASVIAVASCVKYDRNV